MCETKTRVELIRFNFLSICNSNEYCSTPNLMHDVDFKRSCEEKLLSIKIRWELKWNANKGKRSETGSGKWLMVIYCFKSRSHSLGKTNFCQTSANICSVWRQFKMCVTIKSFSLNWNTRFRQRYIILANSERS